MRFWLRERRVEKNHSQSETAQKAGITQAAYSNIENGERNPSVPIAKKIAEFLEFDWTRFYEGEKEKAKTAV